MNKIIDLYNLAHKHFEYKQGSLYWKEKSGDKPMVGAKISNIGKNGYIRVGLMGKRYTAHRLIYLMHHKILPKKIDHIDGNQLNNDISNLRSATDSQSAQNCKSKHGASGIKNVYWHKQRKKWCVKIMVNRKSKSFGLFDDIELAALVALEARNLHHKEFANHC